MSDKEWWKKSVVYQIYPRSFMDGNGDGIGDIPGITSKLDYLAELGIDVVWLSPVYASPNADNGYDISDYRAIMPEFGTMGDWEQMLDEMHKRGIRLLMDLVVNHTSDEHPWFVESRKSLNNPYRDYYIWRPGEPGKPPTDWKASFGGPAWTYDETTGEYYLHMFSPKQPDLNWENPALRQGIYEMMRFWLDKGVDGFRMDVINMISKKECLAPYEAFVRGEGAELSRVFIYNADSVHDYLQEMNREVLSHYDVLTVGECPKVSPEQARLYTDQSRGELNMVFQFEHMGLDKPKGRPKWERKALDLPELKRNLSRWQNELADVGWNSLYWNNHDQPRIVSRFGNDGPYRVQSAKMLATLLHMMRGTPYIYQGEELGMTNVRFESIADYRDIESLNFYQEQTEVHRGEPVETLKAIYERSRDNGRTPMQWTGGPSAGFTSGQPWMKLNPNYPEINAEAAVEDAASLFHYYRKLIELRKSLPILTEGAYELILEEHPSIFAYVRRLGKETVLVINNFYEKETEMVCPEGIANGAGEVLIGNYRRELDGERLTGAFKLILSPYESLAIGYSAAY
ncbi:glycoside hydrolase family 13 protein [Paenibacillus rhizophilus]|uniref:oligo-1,6-glucosidase n=1 Tax=Paenibacillus rhizophilus TaxID=1850366 RepID=A0A3N9PB99_9BACL|nr:alpha-glucosidase [Paenibacillus rhizophilus]RQW12750.1 alpha-glucosidase [Paenibacillus rhizophilus]